MLIDIWMDSRMIDLEVSWCTGRKTSKRTDYTNWNIYVIFPSVTPVFQDASFVDDN